MEKAALSLGLYEIRQCSNNYTFELWYSDFKTNDTLLLTKTGLHLPKPKDIVPAAKVSNVTHFSADVSFSASMPGCAEPEKVIVHCGKEVHVVSVNDTLHLEDLFPFYAESTLTPEFLYFNKEKAYNRLFKCSYTVPQTRQVSTNAMCVPDKKSTRRPTHHGK